MHRIAVVLALCAASTMSAQAPTAARGADSAFARGDWAAALAGYRDLVRRDSTTPAAWFRMGIAQHRLAAYKDALVSLMRARQLGASPGGIELQLARTNAQLGNSAQAFVHIDSLISATGRGMHPRVVRDEPEFASLKSLPRFAQLVARSDSMRYPCKSMPEARQLDFWIGTWDVAPWNAPPGTPRGVAGFNDIQPILEQCVVHENWTGGGGGEGKSYNFFDVNRRKWRQVWIADGGGSLDYTGEFRDGAMRFEGWTVNPQGGRMLQKLTLTPFGRDTVRQTFEVSADSGKTWTATFDARYVRR
jgi:hypothetical protein